MSPQPELAASAAAPVAATSAPSGLTQDARGIVRRLAPWTVGLNQRHALLLQDGVLWDGGSARGAFVPPQRHADFAAWCAQHANGVCDLWLSGAFVHELVCDPALPLAGDAALVEHARAVFAHYHGEPSLAWRLAPWAAKGQQGVSALHGIDLPALLTVAREHGVRVRSLRPWWVWVLRLALQRLPALRSHPHVHLLVVEGRHVGALRLHRGAVTALQSLWLHEATALSLAQLANELRSSTATDSDGAAAPCSEAATAGPPMAMALSSPVLTPIYAVGHGLRNPAGAAAGIEALSALDASTPPTDWLQPALADR